VACTCAAQDRLDGTDAYDQSVSSLGIILQALSEAGAGAESVVRTVIYVTDIGDMELIAKAHMEAFAAIKPVATMVQVSALIDPRMVVEIEAYAIIEDDD